MSTDADQRADPAPAVPDSEVLANAEAACSEIRVQLDHQIRTAEAMDTKAWALVTVTGLVAGLVAPRVRIDAISHSAAAGLVFVVAMTVVGCSILAIRPKADFSFGADAISLVASLEKYPRVSVALGLADALAQARRSNADALNRKHAWYTRALLAFAGVIIGIAWLVYIGAIQ